MQLIVSPCGHFLQHADGRPFFYLADTAWMLFNKLTDEEAVRLFKDRADKGFSAIQAVVFRDLFEPNSPDPQGLRPFASEADLHGARMDPRWLQRVARLTRAAMEHGLFMALLPTWGDKWTEHSNSAGPVIFDPTSAHRYGRALSDALAGCDNVIWILGGDSCFHTQQQVRTIRAMARGIRQGACGDRLMSLHPAGGESSELLHTEDWLSFHALQSSHADPYVPNDLAIERMYRAMPPKPCLEMEACYERMPIGIGQQNGQPLEGRALFNAGDVRRMMYRSVLAGGAGFTYGCESIRQMYRPGDRVHAWDGQGILPWWEALNAPGSSQVQLLKRILLERSYFTRVPAQELLGPDGHAQQAGSIARVRVARCREGGYILTYLSLRQWVTLDTSCVGSSEMRLSVYAPQTDRCVAQWRVPNTGALRFMPESDGDTLLVIDAM